ncbi:hypothetical protein Tco_1177661 [Tanacetum coccineum]
MMYISRLKVALQIELLRARPTTLVEAFSLARMTEARFEDERTTTTIVNPNDLNIAIPDQVLEESILPTSDKVEITTDNDARDQASEVEIKVLVDGKQDDAKVVKVLGVDVEQNNDKPNVLEVLDMIPNGVYRAELEVETIINKMREGRLRWLGHVRRRPQSAPVRRVKVVVVDGSRRRGRPKIRWDEA